MMNKKAQHHGGNRVPSQASQVVIVGGAGGGAAPTGGNRGGSLLGALGTSIFTALGGAIVGSLIPEIKKIIFKPDTKKSLNLILSHPDIQNLPDPNKEAVVAQFVETFPYLSAKSPELLVQLIKTYLQYKTIPHDVLNTYSKLEEQLRS
jgi:hypothetical protein